MEVKSAYLAKENAANLETQRRMPPTAGIPHLPPTHTSDETNLTGLLPPAYTLEAAAACTLLIYMVESSIAELINVV
jgi:hypothetical protein